MKESLLNREKECVRITSELLSSHQMDHIEPLSRRIVCYYSNSFSADGYSLVCLSMYCLLQLPIAILFTPIAVPFLIYMYMSEYWQAKRLGRKYLSYIELEPKHIQVLWNEYGVTSTVEDNVLAETVSKWLFLLCPNEFYIAPHEIEKRLLSGHEKRVRVLLSFVEKDIRVQLQKDEEVTIRRIFDELPNYDGFSENG